jgi:hypothetical protein
MAWRVTIDQRSQAGGSARLEAKSDQPYVADAVEDALEQHHLLHAEFGEYQITVVPDVHARMGP